MSKLKSDIIQKIYKENYLCKEGHTISWEGTDYVYSYDLICAKCGKNGKIENPIRWKCDKCNSYFCSLCLNLIMDKLCPKKHKYKLSKQGSLEFFSTYTCDKCFQKFETNDGVLFDKDCNITVCLNCFYDSCDIPDVLED